MYKHRGFTLIELMVTIAIVGIIVAIAIPSFADLIVKRKLRGATEMIYSQLVFAKGQAIKQSADISVSFTDAVDGGWTFGVTDKASCDPTLTDPAAADSCTVSYTDEGGTAQTMMHQFSGSDFSDVSMSGGAGTITFDPVRGMKTPVGVSSVTVSTADPAYNMQVDVTRLGRVTICSPLLPITNHVSGFPDC